MIIQLQENTTTLHKTKLQINKMLTKNCDGLHLTIEN